VHGYSWCASTRRRFTSAQRPPVPPVRVASETPSTKLDVGTETQPTNRYQFRKPVLTNVTYYSRRRSRNSDWLRAAGLRGRSSSPGRVTNFNFSISSRPALGSTQLPTQKATGSLSPGGGGGGLSGRSVKPTTHLQLAPRPTERECIHPLVHTP
jgi:hypothetical protein